MHEHQVPDCRRSRSSHDRPELFGDERQGLWDQSRAGARHHEGKDRFALRRDHRKGGLVAERFELLVEQPACRRAARRDHEWDLSALERLEWVTPSRCRARREDEHELLGPQGDGREGHRDVERRR